MPTLPSTADQMAAALRRRLAQGLPGLEAQIEMLPEGRAMEGLPVEEYRRAAVLVALYHHEGHWRFPLILRTETGRIHGGQVSLPGGRHQPGETDEAAALREAQEEIGLDPRRVEVLGRLTPVPIPVSHHLVQPVVGLIRKPDGANESGSTNAPSATPPTPATTPPWPPEWRPQPSEVQAIFNVTLAQVLDSALRRSEVMETVVGPLQVPYFAFAGHKVWGATAIILAELNQVLKPNLAS